MQDSRSEVKNNFQTMQLVILRPRKQKEESSSLLQMVSETLLWFKFCDSRMYTSNPQINNKLLPLSFDSFPWSYYFFFLICACSVALQCPPVCDSARLLCLWNLPGKNIRLDCHFLLQGIFPTQGIKPPSPVSPALVGEFFTTG